MRFGFAICVNIRLYFGLLHAGLWFCLQCETFVAVEMVVICGELQVHVSDVDAATNITKC